MKFDVIVGNPPYGKNSNLALKILNRSMKLSELILFVLPRTFNKRRVMNRVDKMFHLELSEDNPDETFIRIMTCTQKWVRCEKDRSLFKITQNHDDFEFTNKGKENVFICRVGSLAGKVLESDYSHYSDEHYYIRTRDQETVRNLKTLEEEFMKVSKNTVSIPSLSKSEIVSIYSSRFH
jgi:uncharacterized ubiquitin-like protein YukD